MDLVLPDKKSAHGADLERLLGRDKVKWDWATLKAYSVDASIYHMRPQAVVLPETEEDIDRVVDYALRVGIPLTVAVSSSGW